LFFFFLLGWIGGGVLNIDFLLLHSQFGTTPFKGLNRAGTFHRIVNDAVVFPSTPVVCILLAE
jgi:hypothetical protein